MTGNVQEYLDEWYVMGLNIICPKDDLLFIKKYINIFQYNENEQPQGIRIVIKR
jgi:hypothetical protein